jgi:hypothetical protein
MQVGTGHGKSVIAQLEADMLTLAGKVQVLLVGANEFLKHWAETHYGTDNPDVQHCSKREYLEMEPNKDTAVVIDEIDLMLSNGSFYLRENKVLKTVTPFCLPAFIREWGTVIGLSGTVSQTNETELKSMIPGVKVLRVPPMRKTEQEHEIVKIVKYIESVECPTFEKAVLHQMELDKNKYKNFVQVFKNTEELLKFTDTCAAQLNVQFPSHTVTALYNFDDEHHKTVQALDQIQASAQFIALTTAEGARGVDMVNPNIAHV